MQYAAVSLTCSVPMHVHVTVQSLLVTACWSKVSWQSLLVTAATFNIWSRGLKYPSRKGSRATAHPHIHSAGNHDILNNTYEPTVLLLLLLHHLPPAYPSHDPAQTCKLEPLIGSGSNGGSCSDSHGCGCTRPVSDTSTCQQQGREGSE